MPRPVRRDHVGDARDQLPVAGVAGEDHHRRAVVVELVEDFRVENFRRRIAAEAGRSVLPAVAAEADGSGHQVAHVDVGPVADLLELLVFLVGETAGQVDHQLVPAVVQHLLEEPRHQPEHPQVETERQARDNPEEAPHKGHPEAVTASAVVSAPGHYSASLVGRWTSSMKLPLSIIALVMFFTSSLVTSWRAVSRSVSASSA